MSKPKTMVLSVRVPYALGEELRRAIKEVDRDSKAKWGGVGGYLAGLLFRELRDKGPVHHPPVRELFRQEKGDWDPGGKYFYNLRKMTPRLSGDETPYDKEHGFLGRGFLE